jgi:RNA polymerase sigma-70 factor (ECF subfamily)
MARPLRSPDTEEGAPRDLDDVTLRRAKAGERPAQTALIERYQRPVFALLWRMVGPDRAVVEDLAQETFLRVLGALGRFEPGGSARLVTWILTIATRLALDHLRARSGHPDRGLPAGTIPVALPRPDQDADRRALAVALVRAVEALGPPFRAAFLLREVHGLRYEEIADALDVDVGTVKSRLARARMLLQAALAPVREERDE